MYNYYFCDKINDDPYLKIYDQKLNINKLQYFIDKYNLICIGKVKEYWINNVNIISENGHLSFHKIIDGTTGNDNNYLIHNYDKEICIPFNFYESHLEDEYTIYENIIEDIKIIIKKYDYFITLHYESENGINNENLLYYNNI
jgi:hypothetical protein